MFVSAEGHVPKVTTWGFGRSMPAEYTMKLEWIITIGGVVVDEGGQAIPGATIEFDGPGNNDALQENIQFGPDTKSVTSADGRWFCNMIPKEMEQVSLHVTHPTHAETSATIRPNTPEATKSIITMKAGFTVAGTIRAANGYPIGDAQVREVRLNEEGEHTTRSDASGAFEFKHMTP